MTLVSNTDVFGAGFARLWSTGHHQRIGKPCGCPDPTPAARAKLSRLPDSCRAIPALV
jgi:hypothetical protein